MNKKRMVEANNFTNAVLFGKEHIVIRIPRRYNTSTAMGWLRWMAEVQRALSQLL
jgi:hypothetical protein